MVIGRGRELDLLADAVASGRSVVLVGEAGIGKTTLASSVLDGRMSVSAQCFRSLAWSAGLPIQQALGRPVPAGDPTWTARWLAGCLGDAALRIEDLHWADSLTLDVVRLLGDRQVVATVRTGEPGTDAALDTLAALDAVRLDLEPLEPDDATTLAGRRHPGLTPAQASALAERCGGNPLLIEEIGDDAEPAAALRRSVARRLRALEPEVREAFGQLVLAGEPVPAAWFGASIDALRAAGLVRTDGDDVIPRHPLLAEAAEAELDSRPDLRIRLARDLAARAGADGRGALAARAFAAAGDREAALDCALRAADVTDRPGDRAALLRLAASCAPESRARELTLRAVEELVTIGDYARAGELVDRYPRDTSARWLGLVGRVRWQQGDDDAALAAFEGALADAGASPRDRLIARCEYARAIVLGLGDGEQGYELAVAAHAEAAAAGIELPRALGVLGTAGHWIGRPEASQNLAASVEAAARSGELMVELTSANNLVAVHEADGELDEAVALAERFAARAEALHLGAWAQQMRAMAHNARMNAGDYEPMVREIPGLLAGTTDARTRDQLNVLLGHSLVDLGRTVDAEARIAAALADSVDDHFGRGNLLYILGEAQLWGGALEAAIATADESVAAMIESHRLFPFLTGALARVLAGHPVPAQEWPAAYVPLLRGAPVELDGLVALAAGQRADATRLFADAARLWTGYHRRGELRCRWLAADADPDDEVARAALLSLEAELDHLGWAPLLGRVRQSLRRRGVRSAAPRGRAGVLTARERQVLDLVAAGLSTDEVAARLSLSRATVAAQVASARSRLGAASRWQAVQGQPSGDRAVSGD